MLSRREADRGVSNDPSMDRLRREAGMELDESEMEMEGSSDECSGEGMPWSAS